MIAILLLIGLAAPAAAADCAYDPAILDLGVQAFDQDMAGGWRTLAARAGCEETAAGIIARYRQRQEHMIPLLYWHEGQLRAEAGQYREAIRAMEQAGTAGRDVIGWNPYVTATVAFLRGDRAALLAARKVLAAWPHPAATDWVDPAGKPLPQTNWPPNLDVVDRLVACFGKPYREAYDDGCRPVADDPARPTR